MLQYKQPTSKIITYGIGISIEANHFAVQNTWHNVWSEAVSNMWSICASVFSCTIYVGIVIAADKTQRNIADSLFNAHQMHTYKNKVSNG